MAHEWKIGDWCEYRGVRGLVYLVGKDRLGHRELVHFVTRGGSTDYSYTDSDVLKHLPDCDSWDWQPPKPIEPPEGYRLLTDGIVINGDMALQDAGWYFSTCYGQDIAELLELGAAKAYARKIEPQYRPFANAEEFKPYRDKWLIDEDRELLRVVKIRPDCKIATCYGSISFKDAFNRYRFEGENGQPSTPFGVLVEQPT